VWSADSKRIFFNKDPEHYRTAHEHEKVFPETLGGYEIYSYDLENNVEIRLTRDDKYQGFL
jgi:Tol biopolymer transport system component